MKQITKYITGIVFLFCLIFCIKPNNVYASDYLYQTEATTSTITVDWSKFATDGYEQYTSFDVYFAPYDIEHSSEIDEYTAIELGTTDTSYTFTDLEASKPYRVLIAGHYTTYSGNDAIDKKICTVRTMIDIENIGLHQESWYHWALSASVKANIPYSYFELDDYYEFKWLNSKNKTLASGKENGNISESFNIKNNKTYKFKVRYAININDKIVYSDWKTINVFEQPFIKNSSIKTYTDSKTKTKTTKIKATWYKNDAAKNYTVYLSTDRTKWTKIKTTSSNTITISKYKGKNLSKKKTYYILVRSNVKSASGTGTDQSGKTYCFKIGAPSGSCDYTQ